MEQLETRWNIFLIDALLSGSTILWRSRCRIPYYEAALFIFLFFFVEEDRGFCELDSYLLLDKICLVTLPDMTSLVTSSHSSTSTASGKEQLTSAVMTGSSKFNSIDIYLRKEDYMSGQPANCGKIFISYNFVLKGHHGDGILAPTIFSWMESYKLVTENVSTVLFLAANRSYNL